MSTSAPSPTWQAQIAQTAVTERNALAMAKSLERAGAPERDVKYALDRAQVAKTKRLMLQQAASDGNVLQH